jgi:hypothetical protein
MIIVTQKEYEILLEEYRKALEKLNEAKKKLDNCTTEDIIFSYTE